MTRAFKRLLTHDPSHREFLLYKLIYYLCYMVFLWMHCNVEEGLLPSVLDASSLQSNRDYGN